MDHSQHAAAAAFLCGLAAWPAHGGSFVGHVLPGVFLCVWGLHWFVSATLQLLTGRRIDPRGAAHHGLAWLARDRPSWLWALQVGTEPVLKVIFPAIAILLEFKLSGTRRLRCPPGSAKAGELDIEHLNSWSHFSNYPPLILSGLADLAHTFGGAALALPAGVPHYLLASAFGSSAFLMLAHTKGEALDSLLHRLLGCCMAALAAAVGAQGAAGRGGSYGLSVAKSLAMLMQGCWFLAISHIMFTHDVMWSASHEGDMTRVMFVPVLFTWLFLGLVAFLLLLYITMCVLLSRFGMLEQQQQHGGAGSRQHGGRHMGSASRKYFQLSRQEQQQPDDAVSFDGCSTDTAIEMV